MSSEETDGRHLAADATPQRAETPTHEPRHAAHAHSASAETPDAGTSGPDTPTTSGATATADDDKTPTKKQPPLVAFVLGLPIVLCLMLLAFAAPSLHSGAKDLPIALSGPTKAVTQVQGSLEKAKPGAFDIHTYDTSAQAADAIKHRDAVGGISIGQQGVEIQTAAGAGTPYSQLLKSIGAALQQQGQPVKYTELAPLPEKDSLGTVMTSAGLPLIFGGMATAGALFFTFRGSFWRRGLGVLGVATIGGLAAAAILHYGFHAVEGSYWMLALAFGMGMAAISFTVLGLAKNLGVAGFALGAILMLFISNPISGLATGPQWLPHPWGAIGQFLPVGAAGTALRSVAYFDGHGAARAWIVLACWALGGFVLLSLGRLRKTHH